MKKTPVSLLFFVLLPALIFAQNPVTKPNLDNYQPARANGPLPPDFLISTAEKAAKDKEKIDQSQDKKMQEAQEQFYLQTNYSVDQMRFSGEVLVNDTFSLYINRVADSLLLKQDPELRHKLRFYILRSPAVNAFTTDQGAIFVTMGLLTRLHSESELAFVLAHEVIHYKRNHVLTGYVEGVKAKEGIGQYDQTTFENRFLKRHRYSRAYESQADEEGFELLVNSNYDPHAGISAFEILAMADGPFSDTVFTKSFFETEHFRFPSKYYTDTIKPFKPADEDEDDDLATHPSVFKRRKVITKKFGKLGADTTGAKYLVSESLFWRVKAMARFEEVAEHTGAGEFNEAIYADYAEQKIYPSNHYLTRELIRSMYGSVIKKNRLYDYFDLNSLFSSILTSGGYNDEKPVGEQGRFAAFVNKTDATGWNVAALDYAWRAHEMFPDDKDITSWTRGLLRELTVKNDIRMSDFEKTDSLFLLVGSRAAADTTIAKKIKDKSPAGLFQAAIDYLSKDSLEHVKYWKFAFINELKDSGFVQMFREAEMYADSLDRVDSVWSQMSSKEKKKFKEQRSESFYGPQGLTSIVAVNPIYVAYDDTGDYEEIDVKSSFTGHDQLVADMKASAQQCGMNLQFLDRDNMDTGSVARFNDLVIASEWFDQRQEYSDNQVLPYPQEKMKELATKYGTQYFMWSAYQSYTSKRRGIFFRVLSLAVVPLAPHTLYHLFTKQQDVYYTVIIYDIASGKPVFVQRTEMTNQKDTEARMKLHVFDVMRLLTTPKKPAK
jgi:hypothetical protein